MKRLVLMQGAYWRDAAEISGLDLLANMTRGFDGDRMRLLPIDCGCDGIEFLLPRDDMERFDAYRAQSGMSRLSVIEAAVDDYVGKKCVVTFALLNYLDKVMPVDGKKS